MYEQKVLELSFWEEMDNLVDSQQHTQTFRALDILSEMPKIARKRPCNPIYNLRNGKKRKRKELSKYFNRVVAKNQPK